MYVLVANDYVSRKPFACLLGEIEDRGLNLGTNDDADVGHTANPVSGMGEPRTWAAVVQPSTSHHITSCRPLMSMPYLGFWKLHRPGASFLITGPCRAGLPMLR